MNDWNNRPQVIFGNLGEEAVLEFAKRRGLHDVLQKGDSASVIDFIFADKNNNIVELAEVKTRKSSVVLKDYPFRFYDILQSQFESNYKAFLGWREVPLFIYVVDAEQGKIFRQSLAHLEYIQIPCRTVIADSYFCDSESKSLSRYYVTEKFVECASFAGTSTHQKFLRVAANVTVDSIDPSPTDCKSFISVQDIKFLTLKDAGAAVKVYLQCNPPYEHYMPLYVTKSSSFIETNWLQRLRVNTSVIAHSQRWRLKNFSGQFVSVNDLYDIAARTDDHEYFQRWWNTEGEVIALQRAEKIHDANKFLNEELGFNLPEDFEKIQEQEEQIITSLKSKIQPKLFEISRAFCVAAAHSHLESVENILNACTEIRESRSLLMHNDNIKVFNFSSIRAKEFKTITMPNNVKLKFYSAKGFKQKFLKGSCAALAVGFSAGGCGGTSFGAAVSKISAFYIFSLTGKTKPPRFIAIQDVIPILDSYIECFAQTIERQERAVAFKSWWLDSPNIKEMRE